MVLDIKKRTIDMTQIQKALILAGAMIVVALLAVNDILPAAFAEYSPLGMLVFLPWVLGRKNSECGTCK